jgi:K+-sensing histidine kinase KdpD
VYFSQVNVYQNKYRYKVLILFAAVLIGGASLLYTNHLVHILAERERQQIDLYAKTLAFISNPENEDAEGISFLLEQIISEQKNISIPVIIADGEEQVVSYINLAVPEALEAEAKQAMLTESLKRMKKTFDPIPVEIAPGITQYIYYENSFLITQLKIYPVLQLVVISIFVFFSYLAFSYSRKAEQDRVWVGLSKETAHQLGTPLSALMAWVEYFKSNDLFKNEHAVAELEKDVERLEMITSRFSNVGSAPALKVEQLDAVIEETLAYLRKRISSKVSLTLENHFHQPVQVLLNKALFSWVIENLCKNAVDAIVTAGSVKIELSSTPEGKVVVDIIDTGKGIARNQVHRVFEPGFTTKQRGWGLGLTLVKRIVESYHNGRIFVKNTEIGKGTTFRILLNAM